MRYFFFFPIYSNGLISFSNYIEEQVTSIHIIRSIYRILQPFQGDAIFLPGYLTIPQRRYVLCQLQRARNFPNYSTFYSLLQVVQTSKVLLDVGMQIFERELRPNLQKHKLHRIKVLISLINFQFLNLKTPKNTCMIVKSYFNHSYILCDIDLFFPLFAEYKQKSLTKSVGASYRRSLRGHA